MFFFMRLIKYNIYKKRYETWNDVTESWSHEWFSTQNLLNVEFHLVNDVKKKKNNVACWTYDIQFCDWQKNMNFYETHCHLFFNCEWLKKHYETLMMFRKFVCKRCFVKFFNNIKLHEHIRTKHAKKFKKISSNEKFTIAFATSKTSIFWSEIVSRSKSNTFSRISIASSKSRIFQSRFSRISIVSSKSQQFINNTTFFNVIVKHMIMKNLYQKFNTIKLN